MVEGQRLCRAQGQVGAEKVAWPLILGVPFRDEDADNAWQAIELAGEGPHQVTSGVRLVRSGAARGCTADA